MTTAVFLEGTTITAGAATARWWSPSRGVFCTEVQGHVGMEVVQFLHDAWMTCHDAARAPLTTFHDWSAVTMYERDARQRYEDLSVAIMNDVVVVHVLIRSRLLAMALEVANLVLGGKLRATSDAAAFRARRDAPPTEA
jgi:hypothetical protein